jgi:hypothetical protein
VQAVILAYEVGLVPTRDENNFAGVDGGVVLPRKKKVIPASHRLSGDEPASAWVGGVLR